MRAMTGCVACVAGTARRHIDAWVRLALRFRVLSFLDNEHRRSR